MSISTKPGVARRTTNALYSGTAGFYAALTEGAGTPANLVTGTAGTYVAGGGSAVPAWAVDPTLGGASLLFEDGTSNSGTPGSDDELHFAGAGLNTTAAAGGVSFFAVYQPTGPQPGGIIWFASTDVGFLFSNAANPTCYIDLGDSPRTSGLSLTSGHTHLLFGTIDADSNPTLRVYDYTSATDLGSVSATIGVALSAVVPASSNDVVVNARSGDAYCLRGRLGGVGMVGGTVWGTAQYNALIADPWCYARATLAASPASTAGGTSPIAVALTSNLIAPYTAGSPGSPAFTKADSGTASTIASQSVGTTSTATLNITPGTSAGTISIGDGFASASLAVTSSPASAVTLSGTPTGVAHSASTPIVAAISGTMAGPGVYTPTSSVAGDTFSPSPITLTSSVQSVPFTCTAITSGVARTITLAYVSGPALTNAGSVPYTPSSSSLMCGAVTRSAVSPTSLGLSVAAPSGGSGTYGPLKVYASTVSNFTPGAGNLARTIASPAFPQPVTLAGLLAASPYYLVVEVDDSALDVARSLQFQASTYPVVATGAGACGQSHAGFVPALGTDVTGGIVDLWPGFVWSNQGYSGSYLSQWQPGQSDYTTARAALATAFAGLKRAVVIYEFGVNDVTQSTTAAAFSAGLSTLMTTMAADLVAAVSGLTSVVSLMSSPIPPAPALGGLTNAGLATLDAYTAAMKALHDGTSILYMGDDVRLWCLDHQTTSYYQSGGIHLTNASTGPGPGATDYGYQVVQQLWAQGIHRAVSGVNVPTPAAAPTGGGYFEA